MSDHNPLTFLTQASPRSTKLMRWALALSEFNVTFKYKEEQHSGGLSLPYRTPSYATNGVDVPAVLCVLKSV